jgi:PST family polysaccharide transporter
MADVLQSSDERTFSDREVTANLKSRAIFGGVASIGAQFGSVLIQLGGVVVLSRLLKPSDFGIFAMSASIVGFADLVKNAGLSAATMQQARISHQEISTLFWINAALGLMFAAAVSALAPAVAWFYQEPCLLRTVPISACTLIFAGLISQHRALLQRQLRMGSLAIIDLVGRLTAVATAVVIAAWTGSYWALVVSPVLMLACIMIGIWFSSGWVPGRPRHPRTVLKMIRFGFTYICGSITQHIERNADNVIIGAVCGGTSLGIYTRAYSLLMLPISNLARALAAAGVPTFSRLMESPRRYSSSFIDLMRIISVTVIPPLTMTVVFADTLIPLALGDQFVESVTIYRWLALVGIVEAVTVPIDWLYITQNRNIERLRLGIVTCVIALIGFAIGVSYGAVGVAASYGIGGILLRAPLGFLLAGRSGPLTAVELIGSVAAPISIGATATAIMFAVRWLLAAQTPVVENVTACFLGLVFYGTTYCALPTTRATLVRSMTLVNDVFIRRLSVPA